jgi:hypothetical protein
VRDGALINDGHGTTTLPVPYTVTATNYSIAVQMRVLGVNAGSAALKFGLLGLPRSDTDPALFNAQLICYRPAPTCTGASALGTQGPDPRGSFTSYDFVSGAIERTYRIEVLGKGVDLCISEVCLDSISSIRPLAPARLALTDQYVRLAITGFEVTTP